MHGPNIECLEDWLSTSLPQSKRDCMLDIGAYRGDFSRDCCERKLCKIYHLFEANPLNQDQLKTEIASKLNFHLHKFALGNHRGDSEFHCNEDHATGSLLPYQNAQNLNLKTYTVKQLLLDDWWNTNGQPKVGLIKIDTQGQDLNVISGAANVIQRNRPWIVIEIIFASLYVGQCSLADVLSWADSSDYALGGFFNDHFTNFGSIAFSDAVLIPREDLPTDPGHYFSRPSSMLLQQEITQLHGICAERLELIERLDAEAQRLTRLVEAQNTPSTISVSKS